MSSQERTGGWAHRIARKTRQVVKRTASPQPHSMPSSETSPSKPLSPEPTERNSLTSTNEHGAVGGTESQGPGTGMQRSSTSPSVEQKDDALKPATGIDPYRVNERTLPKHSKAVQSLHDALQRNHSDTIQIQNLDSISEQDTTLLHKDGNQEASGPSNATIQRRLRRLRKRSGTSVFGYKSLCDELCYCRQSTPKLRSQWH
jgi:hypothetical protein